MFSDRPIVKACAALLAVATISSIPAASPALAAPNAPSSHGTLHHPSDCRPAWVPGPFGSFIPAVTWHDNSNNEDGFTVEWWRDDPQAGWTLLGIFVGPANSTSLVLGAIYVNNGDRVRVRAFNSSAVSSWSNWGTF